MFTYLMIFGFGAITTVIEKKLTGTQGSNAVFMVIEYMMYTVIDMVSTYLALNPLGRIMIVQADTGMYEVIYGSSAIIVSIAAAVIWGIVFGFLNKNVRCDIKIEEQ